jgi:hypothetical protein
MVDEQEWADDGCSSPMTPRTKQAVAQLSGVLGVVWGALLLTRGDQVWTSVANHPPQPVDRLAIRALGARHVVQGTFMALAPLRGRRLLVSVDLLHVGSMVALAVADPSRRRPALVTTAVAAASGAAVVATMGEGS